MADSVDLFCVDIVGESAFQQNLSRVAGGKRREAADLPVKAEFSPSSGDRPDKNAIAVFVSGLQVGLLLGSSALAYRAALGEQISSCSARIVGGWQNGDDEGDFGIRIEP